MLFKSGLERILKSNAGVSIVMVVVALAGVSAGTLYIMDLNKNAKTQFAQARSTSYAEMERRRIGAILGEKTTCILSNNFGVGTKNVIQNDLSGLYTSDNATIFLAKNATLYNGALTVSNIRTRVNPSAASMGLTGSKAYELVVTYVPGKSKTFGTGRGTVVVRVPMYMKVDGSSNVTDCYAMVGNTNVDTAIAASCSPGAAADVKTSFTTATSASTVSDCNHNMNFASGTVTDCPTVGTNATQTVLRGFSLASNVLSYPSLNCTTAMTGAGSCTTDMGAYNINASAPECSYPGGSRDAGVGICAAGQILWHTSGTTTACVTVNCVPTYQFVQTVNAGGTTCFEAPATTCPAGQYVYQFNPDGTDQCRILPVFSGTCAASWFGTSITRATTTSGGTLNCTAYNKTKACSAPSSTNFVTSFNNASGGTANCTIY